jgi:hypothetical protein
MRSHEGCLSSNTQSTLSRPFGAIYGFFDDTGQGDFAPTGVATPQECLRNLVTRVGLYGLAERFDEFAVLMGYLLGRLGAAGAVPDPSGELGGRSGPKISATSS